MFCKELNTSANKQKRGLFMKEVTKSTIIRFCLPEFALGLFTSMINNFLVYFYQPTESSGLPTLITQGYVIFGILTVIGLIKALGHVIDAVSDPIIAAWSDKCTYKNGRRIPFMKYSAIPFALSALLMFWSPSDNLIFNDIWLAFFIWSYYIFYTLYMIPHNALLPEMITDSSKRVDAYTMSSLFFVVGSMLGYTTTVSVAFLKNKFALEPVMAWRLTFLVFALIGVVLLLIPAFTIREKDYVNSVRPTTPLLTSLKHAFSNKYFLTVTLGQLFEGTGMSFFQACIMYYITELMGIPEEKSIIIFASSIIGSLILYPIINKWAKKKGKRKPMIAGCIVFVAAEIGICLADSLFAAADNFIAATSVSPDIVKMVIAIIFALFVSLPFAVLNILPGSMMADIIQYDTITTGINQEGTFSAARSFVTKMGTSIAMMIVPSLIAIGATTGKNIGKTGLLLSAAAGALFTFVAVIIFICYKEKDVLDVIKKAKENK